MAKHELFEELSAFDPRWQENYATLLDAVVAASIDGAVYLSWLLTEEGQLYCETLRDVPDYQAQNEAAKRQRDAEVSMANRGRMTEARGYVTDGDEV